MSRAYTLEELAKIASCELIGDPNHIVDGVDELQTASNKEVSFLANPKYKELLKKTGAGAVCVDRSTSLEAGRNYLISDNPSLAFQKIVHLVAKDTSKSGFDGIHPTAVIHQSSKVESGVQIGPYVVIDRDSSIGEGTIIHPHVSIGPEVTIGKNCIIHSNVTIRNGSIIGNNVILQPGSVIGGCGFGFITDKYGKHNKIQHFGHVIIEDNVEIGSNSTVDRARFKETRIGKGTKIDNLVMVAHNVVLGEDNLIVAQVGISGSVKTGKRVVFAGQAAAVGHVDVADDVILMARCAVSKSIKEKGVYGGAPAVPIKEFHKQQVHMKRLSEYAKRLHEVETSMKVPEETPC